MAMAMLKEEAEFVMGWCISEISQMLHGTRGKSQYGIFAADWRRLA
jgi:hypothetical protein